MNHDLKRLEQKAECDDTSYLIKASTDYRVREDMDVVNYKMIEHIDKILEILRNTKKPEEGDETLVTHLVQKDNDMEAILWEIVAAKYIPQISYQSGRISWLSLEVNDHKFIMKNQHL